MTRPDLNFAVTGSAGNQFDNRHCNGCETGHNAGVNATSKTIAGLIGPTLVAMAVAILLNLGSFPAVAEQLSRDLALIFVSGILLFVAGLAIVRVHNIWAGGWPVLVTALGWVALLSGLARMLFLTQIAQIAAGIAQHTGLITAVAVVLLGLGAFLSFKGYSRDRAGSPRSGPL